MHATAQLEVEKLAEESSLLSFRPHAWPEIERQLHLRVIMTCSIFAQVAERLPFSRLLHPLLRCLCSCTHSQPAYAIHMLIPLAPVYRCSPFISSTCQGQYSTAHCQPASDSALLPIRPTLDVHVNATATLIPPCPFPSAFYAPTPSVLYWPQPLPVKPSLHAEELQLGEHASNAEWCQRERERNRMAQQVRCKVKQARGVQESFEGRSDWAAFVQASGFAKKCHQAMDGAGGRRMGAVHSQLSRGGLGAVAEWPTGHTAKAKLDHARPV